MRRPRAPVATLLALAAAGSLGVVVPASAQTTPAQWDAAREHATRVELHELLERLREQAGSSTPSNRMREEARRRAALVERRLEEGDFQIGDRIVLAVEGRPEMSDTLLVRAGPSVEIRDAGQVTLAGVLRSELQGAMEAHLSLHLRHPVVRAEALIRLSVMGAVERPGFYVVPAHVPVTDVIMLAGGPAGNADLTDLRVERGSVRIWEGESMERAIIQGRTLDQLDIRAGDRLLIPVRDDRDVWQRTRFFTLVLGSVVSLAYGISRFF
jgi:protein involved in polysaccharide export with SLBB domain